jgi:hypothetical protein
MGRQLSAMLAIALAAALLPSVGVTEAQMPANRATAAGLELQISGPRAIRRGEQLKFKGKIVNHSANPVAFALRQGGWDCDGVFRWKVTDTGEHQLPPLQRERLWGVCCLTSSVSEDELIVLQPGEEYLIPDLSDPSDFFAFPGNGFYRVSLRLIFDPSVRDAGQVKPGSKWALAVKTSRVDVWSNQWQMYLTD